ncbi:MAG: hypothetical protein ACI3XC_06420, partial [Phascolarctobacterium sp.]
SYKETENSGHHSKLRTRLFLNGAINEDWSYTGRFHQESELTDATYDENIKLNWAFVTGKIGGVKVVAGRNDFVWTDTMDNRGDGIKLTYGKDIQITGLAMKATSDTAKTVGPMAAGDRIYVADLGAKIGVVNANVRYFKGDITRADKAKEIYEVAAALPVAKDLKLAASYFNGDDVIDGDTNGYLVGLTYKGAKAATVGTWGLYAKYSDRPYSTYLNPTTFSGGYSQYPTAEGGLASDGYKGYEVGANYTVAKNVVLGLKYSDMDAREGNGDDQTLWSEVVFTF